jgi:hypothetical protein
VKASPFKFLNLAEIDIVALLTMIDNKGPSLYYVSKETGWVGSENWQFLPMFSTISADEGWVGQKKSKNVLTLYRDGPQG